METRLPVESGRGAECPSCKDDDFPNSRKIEVSKRKQFLIFTETCLKCNQTWEERIKFFAPANEVIEVKGIYQLVRNSIFSFLNVVKGSLRCH